MLPEKPVLSIQMLEDRYALENHLLDAVHHGDAELAMQALQSFHGVTIPGRKGHTKTTTVRFCAVALNALLRKEAERAEVHAFYLDTLYNDYLLAAGEITTEQQEQALVVEMLQQYCDRVARYSTAGYSVVIRNIIHYINLHLKEDLTPSTLAAASTCVAFSQIRAKYMSHYRYLFACLRRKCNLFWGIFLSPSLPLTPPSQPAEVTKSLLKQEHRYSTPLPSVRALFIYTNGGSQQ